MEKLTQKLLENKSKFDVILTDNFLNKIKNSNYRSTIIELDKVYHKLFDDVDWDLKRDSKLNDEINLLVKMQEILNFDVKKYFTVADENGNESFSQKLYDEAELFVRNWKDEESQLKQTVNSLSNKKLFKSFYKGKINRINNEIKQNDLKYQRYEVIFNKESEVKRTDLINLKYLYDVKLEKINKSITQTIDKHIEPAVLNCPELLAFGKIVDKNYYISSSVFLSNENNKNLQDYFDSSMVTKRLNYYYDNYKKEREIEKASIQKALTEQNLNGLEK